MMKLFLKQPSIFSSSSSGFSSHSQLPSQDYLLGLRGLLVIQFFMITFLRIYLPTAVANSANTTGPLYQIILRKSLSVLFWNDSLIYSFMILLSARTICVPFLIKPDKNVCASALFRRNLRLWIPTFVAFSLSAAAFSTTTTVYIVNFLATTGNVSATVPLRLSSFLTYFNALFEIFWVTKAHSSQAANLAFPGGMLWIVSVLYQQSYTVYMTMVIIPHTRKSWRVKALVTFILTAWWVQSWAWYSVSGLLLADAVLNMDFRSKSRCGLKFGKLELPTWLLYGFLAVVGILLQYLFIAWRPEFRNSELHGHTGLYTGGGLIRGVDEKEPQARDDNYLIVVGIMLLVETYDRMQKALRNRLLVALGNRSFSVFLTQPILMYTAGIKLYLHLQSSGITHEISTLVCFLVSLPLVIITAEAFYRIVDVQSVRLAHKLWVWMRK